MYRRFKPSVTVGDTVFIVMFREQKKKHFILDITNTCESF